jgi:hypothetical protein
LPQVSCHAARVIAFAAALGVSFGVMVSNLPFALCMNVPLGATEFTQPGHGSLPVKTQ